ncbi:MAG: hypothetical protein SOS93_00755 [Mannheimia varigena]|nr:hypothetical protein [Mannheimia varigena]
MTIKRHINRNINKFIQSSLSLAFFTVTGFSTAYCYGWGQAWFHGYPWWHVEVGNCGISRALAYVTGTSLLAFLHYSLIYRLLNHFFSRYELSHNISLRASVFVSVFTLPVLLVFYLATGQIPLDMAVGYLIFTGLFVWLFKKRFTEGTSEWDIRKLFHEEHFWFFNFFIFLYFSMLALYVGYLRAEVRTVYDYNFA